jgi:hypothetical protein
MEPEISLTYTQKTTTGTHPLRFAVGLSAALLPIREMSYLVAGYNERKFSDSLNLARQAFRRQLKTDHDFFLHNLPSKCKGKVVPVL